MLTFLAHKAAAILSSSWHFFCWMSFLCFARDKMNPPTHPNATYDWVKGGVCILIFSYELGTGLQRWSSLGSMLTMHLIYLFTHTIPSSNVYKNTFLNGSREGRIQRSKGSLETSTLPCKMCRISEPTPTSPREPLSHLSTPLHGKMSHWFRWFWRHLLLLSPIFWIQVINLSALTDIFE